MNKCKISECGGKVFGHGMCNKHYLRNRKYGSPYAVKKPAKNTKSVELITSNIEISKGCWLWAGSKNADGYGTVSLNGKNQKAHRVSYEVFNGPIPSNMVVMHKCDRPACVNPEHLTLGVQSDNVADMDRKGRRVAPASENARTAKLTWTEVRQIRKYANGGKSRQWLADKYNLHISSVDNILKNRTWKE